MAFGYWQHKGVEGKTAFVCFDEAYHGDTLGAVSVGGMDLFHEAYRDLLFDTFRVTSPSVTGSIEEVERLLDRHADEIAAVDHRAARPSGGRDAARATRLPAQAARAVRPYDVLLICDEVAVGVGRTGTFFASEQEDVTPDIAVIGKGLSGGYLPVAATITTQDVFDAFLAPYDEFKTFFHGHTYTGNALACAAALANLALMDERDTLAGVREREAVLAKLLEPLREHPHVVRDPAARDDDRHRPARFG